MCLADTQACGISQRGYTEMGCKHAGFRQLKLVRGARSITCFVEFADVATAMAVHNSQQASLRDPCRSLPYCSIPLRRQSLAERGMLLQINPAAPGF